MTPEQRRSARRSRPIPASLLALAAAIAERRKMRTIDVLNSSMSKRYIDARRELWATAHASNRKAYSPESLSTFLGYDPTTIRYGIKRYRAQQTGENP